MRTFDLIVIGSGGGANLVSLAYELGYTVALIEEWKLGGTCLNRGCIPSKMLIHPANVSRIIQEAEKFYIKAYQKSINFPQILKRINKTTDTESNDIKEWYQEKRKGLAFYSGHARFISNRIIEVQGEKITAEKIVIATGARSSIPLIPGLKGTPYLTSMEALRSRLLPKKLFVIGGGYIACELGHAYGALGSEVHLLVRDRALLTREDGEISKNFTEAFSRRYQVHFWTVTEKVEYKKKKFTLYLKDAEGKKSKISGDGLLMATGVMPNSDKLGLENTNISVNEKGFIKVNEYLETAVPGVYSLGDVVGNYMFRHSVNFESQFLFQALFGKQRKPIQYPPMPHAVFTNPEVGSVGMTEEELQKKNISYVVGKNEYRKSAMGEARLSSKEEFVKLLFHKQTRKLLGAHILGEEASTMIHQLIYAMTFGATAEDLLKMIYIHPALPEVIQKAAEKASDGF
ncbi:dihydrolipoyl dehydrogenase [Candidatus Woesearchaeota archaeon]|nr:dihydrolipoyl dehydrogenase [Candidatus Woesearchaeota archaeon]